MLHPKNMASDKVRSVEQLKKVLTVLHDSHRLDDILRQFGEACDEATTNPEMRDFDYKKERVDTMFCNFLSKKSSYAALFKVVRMCLVLPHGQASIE